MNPSTGKARNLNRGRLTGLLAVLAPAVLLVAATLALGRSSFLNTSPQTRIYQLKDGNWSAADRLPGAAVDIQVSPKGIVWVSTSFSGGLSKSTDGYWTSYNGADFGTGTNYLSGGFALAGEDVWGATQEGVIHYDGAGWRFYRDALRTEKPSSIVASKTQVWVIDEEGNFSSFDGASWTIRSLKQELPEVSWTADFSFQRPALALASDGTIWLSWRGLWRLHAGKWDQVRIGGDSLKNARLSGTTPDAIWIAQGAELLAVNTAGGISSRLAFSGIGLSPRAEVGRVLSSGDTLWIASSEGLFQRVSGSWQKIPPPEAGVVIDYAAMASDSTLWVIGAVPAGASRIGPIAGMVALGFGILFLTTRAVTKYVKETAEKNVAVREVVQRSAGSLADSAEPVPAHEEIARLSPAKLSARLLALLLVPVSIGVAAIFLLRRFFPQTPVWVLPVAIAAVGLLIGLVVTLRRARRQGKSKPAARRLLMALLSFAAFYLFDFLVRQAPQWVPGRRNWLWETIAIVVIGLMAAVLLPVIGDVIPMSWANRALRRADYTTALHRINLFLRLRPRSAGLFFARGTILWLAGKQKEAEEDLRKALSAGQKGEQSLQALHLENLAYVLMEQGRYQEAVRSLEGSLDILPDRGGSYVPLAEAYLRQNTDPAKALAMADRAIELKDKSPMQKRANRQAYADAWALRAWALSLLGCRAEAEESIRKALSESDREEKPNFAGTLYHLGQALLSQGNRAAAVEKFSEARAVDPAGNYGSLAARALRENSVWGDRA